MKLKPQQQKEFESCIYYHRSNNMRSYSPEGYIDHEKRTGAYTRKLNIWKAAHNAALTKVLDLPASYNVYGECIIDSELIKKLRIP